MSELKEVVRLRNKVFNVLEFGALTTNTEAQNTAAFSSCISAVMAAGGGTIYIPAGVWDGSFQLPPHDPYAFMPITIQGAQYPTMLFGTVGTLTMPNLGTVLRCTNAARLAVVKVQTNNLAGNYNGFNTYMLNLRDLTIRTSDNPQLHGVDAYLNSQLTVHNVQVDTGVFSVQASFPTHTTCGIITPTSGNGALTQLHNVSVSGYSRGILVYEHTDGHGINLTCCYEGLVFGLTDHASYFGRVAAQRCTRAVRINGGHRFSIAQLNIEHAHADQTDSSNVWQMADFDIDDANNLGKGDISWAVVKGLVGADSTFTKRGATGIRCRSLDTGTVT